MTRPLRRVHLWVWMLLALVLPLLFIAGIASRHSTIPQNPQLRWEAVK